MNRIIQQTGAMLPRMDRQGASKWSGCTHGPVEHVIAGQASANAGLAVPTQELGKLKRRKVVGVSVQVGFNSVYML